MHSVISERLLDSVFHGVVDDGPPIWRPDPDNQMQILAYESEADEVFVGGSAGCGKTDELVGESLTKGVKSVIFRRHYVDLKDMIARAQEIAEGVGTYNGSTRTLKLDNGRSCEFGAIQHTQDIQKWKGRPHDRKKFDEIADFTEFEFRFLKAWTRTTVPGQRCKVECGGNPPSTPEGQWVIEYWAPWLDPKHPYPAAPGELRWFARIDDQDVEVFDGTPIEHNGEMIEPKSRTFIPGLLDDNKYLSGGQYRAELQSLPEPLRSQLLFGDFGLTADDHAWQCIPTEWVRMAQARWKGEPQGPQTALGVDCARGGRDDMVMAPLHGLHFGSLTRIPGTDCRTGQRSAFHIGQVWDGSSFLNMDVIGVGSSPYDQMQGDDIMNPRIRDINVGASAPNKPGTKPGQKNPVTDRSGKLTFKNLRAYGYWKLREALDPENGVDIALPPDRYLLSDLTAPRYSVVGSVIKLEPKDEIKKRFGGRSPDAGDAVKLAWLSASQPVMTNEYETIEARRYSRGRGRGWA